jgi:hypothetical protein
MTITTELPTELTTDADAVRRAKVEALQQRRAQTAPPAASKVAGNRPRRKSVAQGSKIAATAIGMTTMFGLVAAMGAAANNANTTAAVAAPAPVAPAQVVVMIHPAGSASPVAANVVGAQAATAQPASATPIVLSAQPIVRQAPASPAPAAKTNGSK